MIKIGVETDKKWQRFLVSLTNPSPEHLIKGTESYVACSTATVKIEATRFAKVKKCLHDHTVHILA